MPFWHNHETGESQWERPEGVPDVARTLEELGGGGGEVDDAHELREVHDLSDLGLD
jgi:hypothetical protein